MTIGQHIDLVPKDLDSNLEWRRECIEMMRDDEAARDDIWQLCAQDILFYVNSFVWIHEPRPTYSECADIPFITYDYQDEAFEALCSSIHDGKSISCRKSRDMGASWIILTVFEWHWHFLPSQTFLLSSRNENYVDKPGDMKALFQKIDFIHDHIPLCLMPRVNRVKLHIGNEENGSAMNGESTTGDLSTGNRLTAAALDEFAKFNPNDGFAALGSTQFATDCRIINSTYKSTSDAFFAVDQNPHIRKLEMPWWRHPIKARGLYISDGTNPPPDHIGKKRSPWYDAQCREAGSDAMGQKIIATELDMNPHGAQAQFFDEHDIKQLLEKCCDPMLVGELDFDARTGRNPVFVPREGGRLKLWIMLDDEGNVPLGRAYAVGADTATGTGSSNSALAITDRINGDKVASWTYPRIRPDQFGVLCAAMCRFFHDAILVPEKTGPGDSCIDAAMNDCGYGNVYYEENLRKVTRDVTLRPGWAPTPNARWEGFGAYKRALLAGEFRNYDRESVTELRRIIYEKETIWHAEAAGTVDPTGARANHGDRATADMLSWKGVRYSPVVEKPVPDEIPIHSIAGRRMLHQRRARERTLAWA